MCPEAGSHAYDACWDVRAVSAAVAAFTLRLNRARDNRLPL